MARTKKLKHIALHEIKSPDFLKSLSYEELNTLAKDIRDEIISSVSECGGHLSSNLGVVELTIALHRSFNFLEDILLLDVGHQCYAHKILTGRSLKQLRSRRGVSGFIDKKESPYDVFESGHSSISISVADGLAIAKGFNLKKNERRSYIVTLIGDSSLMNGVAFEGLNFTGHLNLPLIIVLNDNGMSISRTVGGLGKFFSRISTSSAYIQTKTAYRKLLNRSRIGKKIFLLNIKTKNTIKRWLVPTTLFDNLGFTYIGPVDGHDIRAIEKCLKRAKKATKPVLLHVKTKKGFGYDKAMLDDEGYWHGATPFHVETGEPKNMHEGYVSWSHIYSEQIYNLMKENSDVMCITPATGVGANLSEVSKDFPKRYFDVGISEEHALSFAEGLALGGKLPIVSIYSTFFLRSIDQLVTDIARQHLKMILLIERAGLVGADGKTHQGYFDASILHSTPNVNIAMAKTEREAHKLFLLAAKAKEDVQVIRIPRSFVKKDEIFEENIDNLSVGDWIYEKNNGDKIALISYGPILNDILDLIEQRKLKVDVYNAIYQKPINIKFMNDIVEKNYEIIIIHDAYGTKHGFTNDVINLLTSLGNKSKIISMCIPDDYIEYDSIENQMKETKVDSFSVLDAILKHN